MENLPPATVGNRQASLFVKISPPILTSETVQDTFLQLRLFDANNNQTIPHTSYFIAVKKNNELLMRDLFHSHSGLITIKIQPTNTPGKWQVFGDHEPYQGGWTSTNDQVSVKAPILLEGGLYHFAIEIFGIDNDRNLFIPEEAPKFDSYLSVGDIYHQKIAYQTKSYDTTIISYYDEVNNFKFDESKKLLSFSMPFNWDMSRIENQNIFVHEEIQIPKSFKEFTDTSTFTAKVNGIPLVGRMLAVDPYSKEDALILHYLINKNDILEMAKKVSSDKKTMDFTLSPGNADVVTSTEILTDFGGIRAQLGWSPTNLKTNSKTDLTVTFFDAFSGQKVAGDVKYDLKILDKNGNAAFSKTDLNAINAVNTQSVNFANNGVYNLEIDIKSITIKGKIDTSRPGIARGYVVIPSTITSISDEIKIPDWVRNNAKWWSEGSIGDKDFASGIQYMIKEGIIKIPPTEDGSSNQNVEIPDWVRNNAKWWSEGSIGDKDFASGIQYMIKIGIISV
ncbi:MAG TPA: peptidase [Nitrosopumilaceae archaeon]|nr:peptidase [Nitrosopumilaceae archaeon]